MSYDYSLDRRNVLVVAIAAVLIVVTFSVVGVIAGVNASYAVRDYRVACIEAGKVLVHGDCVTGVAR